METSPKHHHDSPPSLLPSPNSHSTTSSSSSTATLQLPSPKPMTRSESTNPYPTTFVQADTSSFKQVVQMLTGSPKSATTTITTTTTTTTTSTQPDLKPHTHNIPPIKSIPKRNQTSGFKLYERRNSLKNLKINPIFSPNNSGFSPRKPDILSPSILDFPALVLSPVTPLIPDPFDRSGSVNYNNCYNNSNNNNPMINNNNNCINGNRLDAAAEERAIKEKGFFLHPSPREAEPPRLLPLFPVTSPRVSGSANPSS